MTQNERGVSLEQALSDAQQAIRDFDFAEGLSVTAHTGADYLALTASGGGKTFEYRASGRDLRAEGSTWFMRRSLRSLNDRFVGGNMGLPGEPDHEFLRPPDTYEAGG